VYWPAFLLSAGLPLPDRILVHGYLTAARTILARLGDPDGAPLWGRPLTACAGPPPLPRKQVRSVPG
jgi:hypothetical protein